MNPFILEELFFFVGLPLAAIGLLVYLLVNNSKKTSKIVTKLMPRQEGVEPNVPEDEPVTPEASPVTPTEQTK